MDARALIRAGMYGGIVTIFLAMVGLIERFSELAFVGEEVTFARLALIVAPFVLGLVVVAPRVVHGRSRTMSPREAIGAGAAAGCVAGVAFAAAVLFVDAFGVDRIRQIFLNVSPALMEFVTFDRPAIQGALIIVAISAAAGFAGAGYRGLSDRIRRPLGAATVSVLAMGFLQRIVPIMLDQLNIDRDWLYIRQGGLTWLGAAVVAAVAVGLSIAKVRWGGRIRGGLRGEGAQEWEGRPASLRAGLAIVALLALLVVPYLVGSVVSEVLGTVMIFALLGLGLNIVVGYAGLLDLGYVAFFAFGAYATALLTGATLNTFTGSGPPAISADLNFYIAIPIVMLMAAGVGLLIGAPVLRLRGDYLALVTLGLGEMVTVLITSPWLNPIVGGASGMRGVTDAGIIGFSFRDPKHFYYLGLAFVGLALFVSWRLAGSRIGRAWTAMREDEQIADAMGVSTTRYKLLAFAMGGAIGSLGGALFAVKIGSLTPASFQIIVSIQVLGLVILGGIGSLPGVIVGALVLVGLPGILREFEEYRLLAYGAAVVAVMVLRPQGLIPNVRRSRELQDDERTQDSWQETHEPGADEPPPATEGVTT
jgi:branched-chain amino acid transport system permease protein